MAQIAIFEDDGIETKQEYEVSGSGELELRFGDDTAANLEVDWTRNSVVLKPSANAKIEVIPDGHLSLEGGVDFGILNRSLGTHTAVGFKFPNKARFRVEHAYNSEGHQVGFSLKVRL